MAAEQATDRATEQADEHPPAAPPEALAISIASTLPSEAEQPLSLAELWREVLAGLRLRLPRDIYQTWVRKVTLISYAHDVATIDVSDCATKNALEFGYSGALRLALGDALGREVAVRVVQHALM